ncbi:type III secretion protein C [Duganella sp. CF458]|uniref:type III secretion system outer membrane ring subunit SctC n=1 Tax=Duganella sp. CF458 TaxID=1884368 RepID=UPI0008F019B1|nr:type III secretion system outer membrane ring subunit SctC [Duganella sp. CF458]SFF95827.1 type III secretion protein C [Duganella sp. CF458]
MKCPAIFKRLLLLLAMLLLPAGASAAIPASWKGTGFAINASGMTLRAVLDEFGRVYGVRVSMEVPGQKAMNGRLAANSGSEFLNRLAPLCLCGWFVYNEVLYIVPASDHTSVRLDLGDDAVQDAKAAMVGVGLFDERFGWGELPDVGTVIVSGPRSYVKFARQILLPDEQRAKVRGRRVMVFRLKYASAMDRTINARGQTEIIPGVKTILSGLLLGPTSAEKLADTNQFDVGSPKRSHRPKGSAGAAQEAPRGGNAFVPIFSPAQGGNAPLPATPPQGEGSGKKAQGGSAENGKPRIEASAAMNAILIYDDVQQREMYAALIAELDVPPQQIEIEALIIDMDRSNLAEMGVEWGVRAGTSNLTFNSTAGESQGSDLPLPGATLLISNINRFYARLKALEAKGEARVLATPTVLTLDNVAAVLDLSQTAYVPLVGERVADLADITAGTMLRVIPRLIREADGAKVHLEVDIEDGSLDGAGNSGPGKDSRSNVRVTRSTISTQAIVNLQQTLMIGGYRAERMATDKQKTPVLGDLPLVGGLFRNQTESRSTRERLFLITPRISGQDRAYTAPAAGGTRRGGAASEAPRQLAALPPPPAPGKSATTQLPLPLPLPAPPAAKDAAPAKMRAPAPPSGERSPWALIPAAVSPEQR